MPEPGPGDMIAAGDCVVVEAARAEHVAVLRPVGDIDMLTTPAVQARLHAALTRYAHVVLDLSEVTFFGSSGLKLLVDGDREARELGARLHVAGAIRPAVLRPIQLSGVDTAVRLTARSADEVADMLASGPVPCGRQEE